MSTKQRRQFRRAWIFAPDLTVRPQQQAYTRLAERLYLFENLDGSGFRAQLPVDEDFGRWSARVMVIAASVFFVAGLAYALWCLVVAIEGGFQIGLLGMALLSAVLCRQGLTLFQGRRNARVPGIVSAAAMAIGCSASVALISLPWLSAPTEAAIPPTLRPTLVLLLVSAAAFAVAAAFLSYDCRTRPDLPGGRTRDG